MRIPRFIAPACLALITLLAPAAARAESVADLKDQWLAEAQRVEALLAEYAESATAQEKTIAALQAARKQVEDGLANAEMPVAQLKELESKLTDARDDAFSTAEDAAIIRRHVYDLLEEMETLGARIERARSLGTEDLAEPSGLDGLWRADWGERGAFGIVRFQTKGGLVAGTYRVTDGRNGSLRGSLGGTELRLEIVSSTAGVVGDAVLTVDMAAGRAHGTFHRRDLGSQNASGELELKRMSEDDALAATDRAR